NGPRTGRNLGSEHFEYIRQARRAGGKTSRGRFGGTVLAVLVLGRIFLNEQTRGVVRDGGRHCGFGLARPGRARDEAAGRNPARAAGPWIPSNSLGKLG